MRPDPLPNALRAACGPCVLAISEAEVEALVGGVEAQAPPFAVWVEGETAWLALPGLDEAIALQRAHLPLLAAAIAQLSRDWS